MRCRRRPPCSATPTWPAWRPAKRPASCPKCSAGWRSFSARKFACAATVRTLLAYPVLLAGVSSLVVIGLVTFVLPKFVDIFSQFEVPLPVVTQVVVAMSDVLRTARLDLAAAGARRVCRADRVARRRGRAQALGRRHAQHADPPRHHARVLHRPHVSLAGPDDRKRRAAAGRLEAHAQLDSQHPVPPAVRRSWRSRFSTAAGWPIR